jgi:uncharacterized protein
LLLQNLDSKLVGIEVKNRESVNSNDFKGLKMLQAATNTDFACGVILYRGKEVVPFGKGLWALPLSALWN